jgi:hypothetical protein
MACSSCEGNSTTSSSGATSQSSCYCPPGYEGTGACQVCQPGSYKEISGPSSCIVCANGASIGPVGAITPQYCQCGPG